MRIDHPWQQEKLLESLPLLPLSAQISRLPSDRFPGLQELNELLAHETDEVRVRNGKALRFVPQDHGKLPFEAQYEPRCYLHGEVQSRENNWHDLFNALVWLAFPSAKRAINVRHYAALTSVRQGTGRSERGAIRDMNTLFDESGVVVPYADEGMADLLCGFSWKQLFWLRRSEIGLSMDFYLFGHGLYEKVLNPYIGLTGQGLLLKVDRAFFDLPLPQRLQRLDESIARYLDDPAHCMTTHELTPVPLLGIPGWAAENEHEEYYEDTRYFRPGRRIHSERSAT
jgi:hypothetical protein